MLQYECTYGDVGVTGATLGIGGGEDGVDKDEGANNLSTKAVTFGVTIVDVVGTTTLVTENCLAFKTFNNTSTTDSTQALHHYVEYGPCQGQLPPQEQTECHRRVNVTTCH